jgi:hypothetical protein
MQFDTITLVSGLPRSGTSLMMQMLGAGGMSLLTDGQRVADESNPRGYFELEPVKLGRNDLSWLAGANGRVVKVIHLLLMQMPTDRQYQVIFMLRDLGEVIDSQRAMLRTQGKVPAALADDVLSGVFTKQLATVKQWLAEQPNFRVFYVPHGEVIRKPLAVAQEINKFLGGALAVESMVEAVRPELYRQRKAFVPREDQGFRGYRDDG